MFMGVRADFSKTDLLKLYEEDFFMLEYGFHVGYQSMCNGTSSIINSNLPSVTERGDGSVWVENTIMVDWYERVLNSHPLEKQMPRIDSPEFGWFFIPSSSYPFIIYAYNHHHQLKSKNPHLQN